MRKSNEWIKRFIEKMVEDKNFTGKIVLNCFEGTVSKQYKITESKGFVI